MSDVKTEKLKALQLTLDKLEKEFGEGTIMRLGDSPIVKVEAIPTGSIGLDIALGIGGFPKGRVVEIYGPESSGTITLALHVIAEAQKKGDVAAFIEAEHAFVKYYCRHRVVDVVNLLIFHIANRAYSLEDGKRIGEGKH